MHLERRQRMSEAFDRAAEIPMLVLSILIVPLLIIPFVVSLSNTTETALLTADYVIWGTFATELAIKTYLAPNRHRYLLSHWYDVLIVAIPFLRPLRITRSLRILRLARVARLATVVIRIKFVSQEVLGRHGLHYALVSGLILTIALAALVAFLERNADGNITDFGTALWWAAVTVTTVGYGDAFPITPEGRGVGVVLMLLGITLFGVLTANIAAFFVEEKHSDADMERPDLAAEIGSLRTQVAELNEILRRFRGLPGSEVSGD